MGLFRKLGREVQQFAEDAKAAAEDDAVYECAECGARFDERPDRCPECDAESFEKRWAEGEGTSTADEE
ncbi:MAG: hypothetical protein ABEJ28_10475 [Salinigranum sp.]